MSEEAEEAGLRKRHLEMSFEGILSLLPDSPSSGWLDLGAFFLLLTSRLSVDLWPRKAVEEEES